LTTIADFTEFYSFCVSDIDGDNYPDLIGGSAKIFTFMNNGKGQLLRDTINENTVISLIHQTRLADLDGDHDLDLLVCDTNTLDKVDLFTNDGKGSLSKNGTLTSLANNIHDLAIGDADNDSQLDLCLVNDHTVDLIWSKNQGNGSFSSEKYINDNVNIPRILALGDLDNDGDLDLCHSANNSLFLHMNSTDPLSAMSVQVSMIVVYPNPFSSKLTIDVHSRSTIKIHTMMGRTVFQSLLESGKNYIYPEINSGS